MSRLLAASLFVLASGVLEEDSVSLLQTSRSLAASRRAVPDEVKEGLDRLWFHLTGNGDVKEGKDAVWPAPDAPNRTVTAVHRATVAAFKASVASGSAGLINLTETNMGLLPVSLTVEEGVHKLLCDVLRNYSGDEYQYVQQGAWRGLSDQANTELGAATISDIGGKDEGVRFLVRQLRAHPQRLYGYCADQCTVQYEALAVIGGLILTDMTGSRTKAAMEEGLAEATVHAMRSEYDLQLTQHTACRVMTYISWQNTSYLENFKALGAQPLIDAALARFDGSDSTPFHFGFTVGNYFPMSQCDVPKLLMEGRQQEASAASLVHVRKLEKFKPYLTFRRPA